MSKPKIALIDGDIIGYKCAAATEKRTISVLHKPTNKTKVFKNRTEFKEAIDLEKYPLADFSIQDVQEPSPIEHTLYSVKNMIKTISESVGAIKTEVYISGKPNFRDFLALPQAYKGNRLNMIKPLVLEQVKTYMENRFKAVVCEGEADDMLAQRQYECREGDWTAIACTIDKDAMGTDVGTWIFNWETMKAPFQIPDLGKLWINSDKEVKGYGRHWEALQWLVGDVTDNIKPTFLCKSRYGEKGAYKDLADLKTEEEIYRKVFSKFKEWYPEPVEYVSQTGMEIKADWIFMCQLYYEAIHMKRFKGDTIDVRELAREYGI